MTFTLLLQLYLAAGLAYGLSVVCIAEAVRPPQVPAEPLERRLYFYAAAVALGALVWPVGLVQDFRGGS